MVSARCRSDRARRRRTRRQTDGYARRVSCPARSQSDFYPLARQTFINSYVSLRRARQVLECTSPTALKAIADLERQGIVHEITGGTRNRLHVASEILDVLQAPIASA